MRTFELLCSGAILRASVVALAALVIGPSPVAAQPANDACSAATSVGALQFVSALDTTLATAGGGDPASSCGGVENNVWYTYTAASDVSLSISAVSATYDTNVNVYSGTCALPVEIGCSSDTPLDSNGSRVVVPLVAGETVVISVADNGGPGGGPVTVTFDEFDPPYVASIAMTEAVSTTDASPLGGEYSGFESTVALNQKDIAFVGRTDGIFMRSGGILTTIAVSGDPSPIGGTFHIFGRPSINDAGDIAFFASVEGGTADSGIFIYDSGVITSFLVEGGASPDGGTFETFRRNVVLESGGMAYLATTSMSGGSDRLFTTDFLTSTVMATEGDPTPCGGIFQRIGFAGANSRGFDIDDTGANTVFVATAAAGGEDGIFHADGVTVTAIACEDAPTVIGGTYRNPGDQPGITGSGDVYFYFGVVGGPVQDVIWKWNAGVTTPEIATGTLLGSGETVSDIDRNIFIAATSPGYVGFVVEVGSNNRALVLAGPGVAAPGETLAVEGGVCPLGATHEILDFFVGVSSVGNVAYEASCGGGAGTVSVPFGGAAIAAGSGSDTTTIGTGFDFVDPMINAAGTVAFRGARLASYAIECKSGVCGAITSNVTPQTAVPGMAGQVIHALRGTTYNGTAKEQAFIADTSGPAGYSQAVLGVKKGVLALHALEEQALPGGVGTFGPFTADEVQPSQGNGVVAFRAEVSGHPTAFNGIFAATKSTVVTIALEGDLSPTGGVFDLFGVPTARGKSIVFRATTDIDDCIYSTKKPGQPLLVVVCDGDPAPPSLGGGVLTLSDQPPTGLAKAVTFTANDCVAVASSNGISSLRCVDDPYIRGDFISAFGSGSSLGTDLPRAEAKGKGLLFTLNTLDSVSQALVAERKGEQFPVLETGLTVAPTSGGTLSADSLSYATMSKKTVVFAADIFGGTARAGVFQVEID